MNKDLLSMFVTFVGLFVLYELGMLVTWLIKGAFR
jgi:Sec-independent protein secretion pathway component TatC